jgi:CHAT domain-containing protein
VLLLLSPSGEVLTKLSPAKIDDVSADLKIINEALRIFTVPRGGDQAGEDDDGWAAATSVQRNALQRLWQALSEPVAENLPERGALILIPYRELTLVPYALLEDRDGSLLADRFAVTIAPSLAILRELLHRGAYRSMPRRAYLVGDPTLDAAEFLPPLRGAYEEALNLKDRLMAAGLGSEQIMLRHGSLATVRSYRSEARTCDLVHLACHGRLEEPADASRLYLAPEPSHDGLLPVSEIADVPLADALVFLSACQTGQGRATADGVIGFGRAFLEAGARTVIASLWKVADAATSAFVGHFYGALLGTTRVTLLLLQTATLALREDLAAGHIRDQDGRPLTATPANWAPFFVLGDGVSVRYGEVETASAKEWT